MAYRTPLLRASLVAVAAALSLLCRPITALACGCFAPPDPASPVVQAGENILFQVDNGQVTAHIQIQYAGEAKDFGWLLPLPSVPTLEVGSDDVFRALINRTGPGYKETVTRPSNCDWGGDPIFGSSDLASAPSPDFGIAGDGGNGGPPPSPLVVEGGIGPYDYAVLKADARQPMLDWLAQNRYFVPAGTDAVLTPYIHPGGYFLALKLHSGSSTGDIQPVVVHYASDLPMIPIVLTSVTSSPNLGVWVWVLGPSRAIPRNYHHVVLDDAALDWSNGSFTWMLPPNYETVVDRAVKSAPGKHAFVTELAGPAATITPTLFTPGRFGDLDVLRRITDVSQYLGYLKLNGYNPDSTLLAVLQKYIKQPPSLEYSPGQPVAPANYYFNFDYWKQSQPKAFEGVDLSFDAKALTDEIEARIVKPVRDAQKLFEKAKYLTRLHTWLAPADMTADPVFSFNPQLPDVSNLHDSRLVMRCGKMQWTYDSALTTEQGFVVDSTLKPLPVLPWALRIEDLREMGAPEVLTDNMAVIKALLALPGGNNNNGGGTNDGGAGGGGSVGGGGCSMKGEGGDQGAGGSAIAGLLAVLLPLGMMLRGLRRRQRR